MKKLNKKWIIIFILLLIVIIMASVFITINKYQEKSNNSQPETKENTYEALVSINPLIKLEFKEVCHLIEENNNSKNYFCDEPKVTNYELINDDAKDIYSDLDFNSTNGCLSDVLVMIAKKARENGIVFESVHVSSDWENIEEYKNKNESLDIYNFEVNIVNKEELNIEENQKFLVTFNSDGGSLVDSQEILKGNKVLAPESPTKEGYLFIEWQLNDITYDFDNKIESNIELKAVWKKENVSNNQNTKPNVDNNSSKNENNTIDNNQSQNDNNDISKEETVEKPTSTYDFNLNDNIIFDVIIINYYEKLSTECVNQIKEVGYGYRDVGDFWIENIEYSNHESDYNSVMEEFPSCFNKVSPSTVDKLNKEKGIRVNQDCIYSIRFLELAYNYQPFEALNLNKYNLAVVSSYGYGVWNEALLTEEVCQEFNLSCGRW